MHSQLPWDHKGSVTLGVATAVPGEDSDTQEILGNVLQEILKSKGDC